MPEGQADHLCMRPLSKAPSPALQRPAETPQLLAPTRQFASAWNTPQSPPNPLTVPETTTRRPVAPTLRGQHRSFAPESLRNLSLVGNLSSDNLFYSLTSCRFWG